MQTLSERIADLEEQVAYLKSELGISRDMAIAARFKKAFGLTRGESSIVAMLYSSRFKAFTKDQLFEATRDAGRSEEPGMKVVDVLMYRVRRRLGYQSICTIHNRGYALTPYGVEICDRAMANAA